MKTKSFKKYLETRLSKEEIEAIDQQAKLEVRILESIQNFIVQALHTYMKKNKVGFNELVRRLEISPSHAAKIQRGEANLTLASLAHLFALLGQEPQDIFKSR